MARSSCWNEDDVHKLSQNKVDVYVLFVGIKCYWEQIPLVYKKEHYAVEPRECKESDIVEIDTFCELKVIDKTYDV